MPRTDPIPIAVMMSVWLTMLLVLPGCGSSGNPNDERLVGVVTETQQRQAEQNQEMARLNREVAEGTKRLVDADAKSRDELLAMSREIQEQHTQLENHRQDVSREVQAQQNQLENDRRELAVERWRESLLAPVLSGTAILLVCSLPLVLCWYLLHGLRHEKGDDDNTLSEMLVVELVADRPMLLLLPLPAPTLPLGANQPPENPAGEVPRIAR